MIISSPTSPPHIPDDLTLPQFIFDYKEAPRPLRDPSTPWLIDDETGRKIREGELRSRTTSLAAGLKAQFQIGDDDVVLLCSRNHVDYPVVIWAANYLGAIVSCANPDFSANELLYQIEQSKASVLIVGADVLEVGLSAASLAKIPTTRVVALTSDESAEDVLTLQDLIDVGALATSDFPERQLKPGEGKTKAALYMFSSGTTGRPKAVAISHYSVIANVLLLTSHNRVGENYCDLEEQRYRPGDIALAVLPLFHIYGLVFTVHVVLYSAMSSVIVPRFSFEKMLQSIVRHKISHLFLVPPQVVLLCKHPAAKKYDLQKYIRMICFGAAPLSREMHSQLLTLYPDAHIGQGYGMTECTNVVTLWPINEKQGAAGCVGVLIPGCEAKIVKLDGTLAGFDEPGELYIKTPSRALEYVGNPEATKETFVEGWVRSGDEGKFDCNGQLWILDRIKEFIKVKGFQVAPAELEGCILEVPDVSSACVVGIPDDYSGEVPLAFVVLSSEGQRRIESAPEEVEAIKQRIIKHIAKYKAPIKHLAGGVEIVTQIPTSASGKILRRVLREQAKQKKKESLPVKPKL